MFREVDFQALKQSIESGETFILDVFAKWCHPCKLMDKELESIMVQFPDLHFLRIDYDLNTEVVDFLGIGSLPYLFIFRDGKQVGKIKGFHKSASIGDELRKSLN